MSAAQTLHLAANQGQVGGGEVMLLRCATTARDLGLDVRVVAPSHPDQTLRAAADLGLTTVAVPGRSRADYARLLRRWDAGRRGVLWCHGLLPALATAGHPDRIVHLHQLPAGPVQRLSATLARRRALAVVVPSAFLAAQVSGSQVLTNWTDDTRTTDHRRGATPVVGYLGRLSHDKGVDVLAEAVGALAAGGRPLRLLVAGDFRFVPDDQRRRVSAALLAVDADRREWMPRDAFFDAVDVAVVASTAPESFGLAAAEAMAAGVPVVVSDAGALTEVVGPAHPWVSRAGDAEDLARALAAALDADAAPVVAAARDRWQHLYSPAAGRAAVRALLEDLGLSLDRAAS